MEKVTVIIFAFGHCEQLSKSIKSTLDDYYSATVISAFNYGKKIFTYEEFMKPETKDVIAAMASLLEELK